MAQSKKQKKAQKRGYPTQIKATNLAAGKVRAGKGKGSLAQRKGQNIGVKHGTIRLGRGGKTYNVYDAKTATWKRGVVSTAKATKPKSSGEPPGQARKAPKTTTERQKMRYGYQYTSKYNKPTSPYSQGGGSSLSTTPVGSSRRGKTIRPSGGPTRYARFSKKKK